MKLIIIIRKIRRKQSLKKLEKNGVKRRLVVLACKLITQSSAVSFEWCGLGAANQNIVSSISCRWITSGALWAAAADAVTDKQEMIDES